MKLSKELKAEIKSFLKEKLKNREQRGQIIAPYQLGAREVKKIQSKISILQGIPVDVVVDESIMAGFVVRVGSRMIDYSLKSRIDNIF